jgi:hypothetical protein
MEVIIPFTSLNKINDRNNTVSDSYTIYVVYYLFDVCTNSNIIFFGKRTEVTFKPQTQYSAN